MCLYFYFIYTYMYVVNKRHILTPTDLRSVLTDAIVVARGRRRQCERYFMLLTFILIISSIPSPLTLSFQAYNLPFLQILPTVAFLFFFRTDSTDSRTVYRYF